MARHDSTAHPPAMARREVEDTIRLRMRVGPDQVQERWWRIEQPVASVALTLRGRIGAALGPAADQALLLMFRTLDPQTSDDLVQDAETVGDALALATFRRARSGQSITVPGESLDLTAGRLTAVAAYVARASGASLDATLLLGEHERQDGGRPGYRWAKPALLYRLLMDSAVTFGGSAPRPLWPSGVAGDEATGAALFAAQQRGSIGEHVAALDALVAGPDELLLLVTWALLHLWRPF